MTRRCALGTCIKIRPSPRPHGLRWDVCRSDYYKIMWWLKWQILTCSWKHQGEKSFVYLWKRICLCLFLGFFVSAIEMLNESILGEYNETGHNLVSTFIQMYKSLGKHSCCVAPDVLCYHSVTPHPVRPSLPPPYSATFLFNTWQKGLYFLEGMFITSILLSF